jgi:hypothetical protein
MILAILILFLVLVLVAIFYNSWGTNKKSKVAFIYNIEDGWVGDDPRVLETIAKMKIPKGMIVIHREIPEDELISPHLYDLYKEGVRIYIGFASSNFYKQAEVFRKSHNDCKMIHIGYSVDDLTSNIHTQKSDTNYL